MTIGVHLPTAKVMHQKVELLIGAEEELVGIFEVPPDTAQLRLDAQLLCRKVYMLHDVIHSTPVLAA